MSTLDKLKLMENTRRTANSTPEGQLRNRMVDAINQQIAAAEAMQRGESFQVRRQFWGKAAGGEKTIQEKLVRFRPWFWQDGNGAFMLEVRSANKVIELKPKKSAIEVGAISELVPTLALLREAVVAGELDKQLIAAKGCFGKKLP